MQIKNSIVLLTISVLFLFIFNQNLTADEFDISAIEITVDKKNNIVVGKGSVEVIDRDGKIIKSDKAIYEKSKEFLTAEGSVEIIDELGNILKTDKIIYDKEIDIITSFKNSELLLKDGYKLKSNKLFYNNISQKITSDENSILTDIDGNTVWVDMFEYHIEKGLFSSIGKIKINIFLKNCM